MKRFSSIVSVLIILGVIYWSFADLKPSLQTSKSSTETDFSIENALNHLEKISKEAHYTGSKEHKKVQSYIVTELQKMGFETEIQTQTAINKKWFAATTAENIIAKLKGSGSGKALLLLTHYDSNPHSSLGASDAGSGVVTILEGLRAFIAKNETQKNDIVEDKGHSMHIPKFKKKLKTPGDRLAGDTDNTNAYSIREGTAMHSCPRYKIDI
jgi:hypothetical protein